MPGERKSPRRSNYPKRQEKLESRNEYSEDVEMVGVNFFDGHSRFQRPFLVPRSYLVLPELEFCEEIRSFERFHLPLRHVRTEVRNTLPKAADIAREAAILEEIENQKKQKR